MDDFERRVQTALQQDPALRPYGGLKPHQLESTLNYAFREGHRTSEILSCNPHRRRNQVRTAENWDGRQLDFDRPSEYFANASIKSEQARRLTEADRKRSAQRRTALDAADRRQVAEDARRARLPVSGKPIEESGLSRPNVEFTHASPLGPFDQEADSGAIYSNSGKRLDNYQLVTHSKKLDQEEEKTEERINGLRKSLAKEEINKRNIEWQKTHNTALARKIRETNAIARSLPRLPLPRKRFTVQIVDPASASPIRNFEEELEKYEKELEEKKQAEELERKEEESEERNKPKRRRIEFLSEEEKTEETEETEETEKTDKEKTGKTAEKKQKRKRKHSEHDRHERKREKSTSKHSEEMNKEQKGEKNKSKNKEKNKEQYKEKNEEKNDSPSKRKRKRVSQLYQLEEKLDQNKEKDPTQKDIIEPADENKLVELSLEDVLGFDPLDLELDLGLDLLNLDEPLPFDKTPPPQDPSSPSRCPAKTAASGAKADMSSVEPPPGLPAIASDSSIGKPPSVNIS